MNRLVYLTYFRSIEGSPRAVRVTNRAFNTVGLKLGSSVALMDSPNPGLQVNFFHSAPIRLFRSFIMTFITGSVKGLEPWRVARCHQFKFLREALTPQ